jgi:hypothetical protein
VTDPRLHEMLAQRLEPDPAVPMNETEEELLRYLSVAAALLPQAAERYKALSARLDAEGTSPELRAEALDAAGDLAVVLQSAHRHHVLYVVLDDRTDLAPLRMLTALDDLFHSLVLLTEPTADEFIVKARLTPEAVDAHLEFAELRDYLDPDAAMARLHPGG